MKNPINLDGVYFHIEYLHYSKTGRSSGQRLELNKPMKKELKNRFNALRGKFNNDSVLFSLLKFRKFTKFMYNKYYILLMYFQDKLNYIGLLSKCRRQVD